MYTTKMGWSIKFVNKYPKKPRPPPNILPILLNIITYTSITYYCTFVYAKHFSLSFSPSVLAPRVWLCRNAWFLDIIRPLHFFPDQLRRQFIDLRDILLFIRNIDRVISKINNFRNLIILLINSASSLWRGTSMDCSLPYLHEPCFQAGYWVNNDVD